MPDGLPALAQCPIASRSRGALEIPRAGCYAAAVGILKSNSDIRYLKEAARLAGEIGDALLAMAAPGIATPQLEEAANRLLAQNRSSAPFKHFEGFGHAICVSINDEVVNGPPSRVRILREGDVVSIALGTELRGLHGKVARTGVLGESTPDIRRLLEGTAACFERAVAQAETARTLNEVLRVIPETAAEYKLSLVECLGGTGIGKKLHDYPPTPNNPDDLAEEIPLEPGMAFTLMPMFSLGTPGPYRVHEDGWTYCTHDGAQAAHMAETMLMTDAGLLILSR